MAAFLCPSQGKDSAIIKGTKIYLQEHIRRCRKNSNSRRTGLRII